MKPKAKERNMSTAAEIYVREADLVESVRSILENPSLSKEELLEKYTELGREYGKLLKQTIKITRIGDTHQRKLLHASEEIEKQRQELSIAYEKLDLIARTDPLTDLSNRRDFLERFEHEVHRFERNGDGFTLALGDIDHFKGFNDQYGHDCGDFVLVQLSAIMRSMVRKIDSVGRWGGEEFIILLPHSSLEGGFKVADNIRKKIAESTFTFDNRQLSVAMTFGITAFEKDMDVDECVKRADEALYFGKKNGRNRVVTWPEISKAHINK